MADAQSPSEPSLAFTISAGMTTGGRLWSFDNQQLAVPGASNSYDTVSLGRRIRPGIAGSLSISYYRSPHFGLNAEIAYFGLGTEQSCRHGPGPYAADSERTNEQACTNANGIHQASSVIAFMVGGTWKFLGEGKVQPYVRANGGLALLGNSFVETVGVVHLTACATPDDICPYSLLSERKRAAASWVLSLAGGFVFPLSPGYRVRMEGRDLMMMLPRVTGPAPLTSSGYLADTKMTMKHVPAFMIGLDVLLERRHTRRY